MWNICMVPYHFASSVGFFVFWECSFLYMPWAVWLLLPQATSLPMLFSWIALKYSLFYLGAFCWLYFVSRKTIYLVSYVGSHSLCHFVVAWREATIVSHIKGSLIYVVLLRWEQLCQILFVPQFIIIFFWMKLPYYLNWNKYFCYHIFNAVLYLNIFWCTVQ